MGVAYISVSILKGVLPPSPRSPRLQSTVEAHHILAFLTGDVGLQPSPKRLVHNAATVRSVGQRGRLTARVVVQNIQSRNEELVCILLLIACEVACVGPDKVQQLERNVGRRRARVELQK
jgi:hypothetical protein